VHVKVEPETWVIHGENVRVSVGGCMAVWVVAIALGIPESLVFPFLKPVMRGWRCWIKVHVPGFQVLSAYSPVPRIIALWLAGAEHTSR